MQDSLRHPVILRRTVCVALLGALTASIGAARAADPASGEDPDFAGPHPHEHPVPTGARTMRVFTWTPPGRPRATVLFSHGALSAPDQYQRLLGPWAAAGFTVHAPLHADSLQNPDHASYGMLDSWRARLQDMRALSALFGASGYVAAGHSYGALTALTLGGASPVIPPNLHAPLGDPAARAVIAFSPPGPSPGPPLGPPLGMVPADAYATVSVPLLVETGDRDIPPGVPDGDWHTHLAAFDQAAGRPRYALTLPGVDHYFGGLICKPRPTPPQTAGLARAVTISSLFLHAYGAGDATARTALARAPDVRT